MKQFKKIRLIKKWINNPVTNFQENYWSEGVLGKNIEVGEPIILLREKRADYHDYTKEVITDGIFTSSLIKEINGNLITTQNSTWEIRELNEEKD